MNKERRYNNSIVWIVILLCFISRIPMLTSPYMVLDGDESVVGLMAKHLYEGKGFPVYFYGQRYGLSIIEELFIVPFYYFIGIKGIAVKLAMLLLWSIGVVFFYKTCLAINKKNTLVPVLLTVVLIVCPAWAEWSMKARGGYVTAFTLSAITTYLLVSNKERPLAYYVLLGILLVLVYESMPLWLPLLVLLIIYKLIKEFSIVKLAALSFSVGFLEIGIQFYKRTLYVFHHYDEILPVSKWGDNLGRIPEFLYTSLHGYHYFFKPFEPGIFQKLFALLFICILIVAVTIAVVIYVNGKLRNGYVLIYVTSIIAGLVITIVTPDTNYRFLLPVTVMTLLLCQTMMANAKLPKWLLVVPLFMISIGIGSLITFRNFRYTVINETSLHKVINYLNTRGIKYTYSCHVYLPWQMIFYSKEAILSRDVSKQGRIPEYHRRIDSALHNGAKTAFIGLSNDYYGMNISSPIYIDSIFVMENLPEAELAKNFQLQFSK